MLHFNRISIVGAGLIGGSVLLAAKKGGCVLPFPAGLTLLRLWSFGQIMVGSMSIPRWRIQ
jgi:hypothetical protein